MNGRGPKIRVTCAARDPYFRDPFVNCVNHIYKYIILDFIGNSKKRPEGCCQIFKPLEENLRDGAHRLLPIMSII
jgi:hypothetical protein